MKKTILITLSLLAVFILGITQITKSDYDTSYYVHNKTTVIFQICTELPQEIEDDLSSLSRVISIDYRNECEHIMINIEDMGMPLIEVKEYIAGMVIYLEENKQLNKFYNQSYHKFSRAVIDCKFDNDVGDFIAMGVRSGEYRHMPSQDYMC